MIFIYPSIEDYYLPTLILSRTTFILSYHSSDYSLFFLVSLDDLLGRPFPLGRPGRPGALPCITYDEDSLSESSAYKSSSSREWSSERRKALIDLSNK